MIGRDDIGQKIRELSTIIAKESLLSCITGLIELVQASFEIGVYAIWTKTTNLKMFPLCISPHICL